MGGLMNRSDLKRLLADSYMYFRLKDPANSDQIDMWHISLGYIDAKAIPYILKQIQELDNLPRNLPKLIKSAYEDYKRQNKGSVFVKYDPYDDPRYPIEKLHKATEIYIKSGRSAFLEYCRISYMPSQDVERVENKVKVLIDRGTIQEVLEPIGVDVSGTRPGFQKESARNRTKRDAQERFGF